MTPRKKRNASTFPLCQMSHSLLHPFNSLSLLAIYVLIFTMSLLADTEGMEGELSNYHSLFNYSALISRLDSSGTSSPHVGAEVFSSEWHLSPSVSTTTKINNVWIMSVWQRWCVHLSLWHLNVRDSKKNIAVHRSLWGGPQNVGINVDTFSCIKFHISDTFSWR